MLRVPLLSSILILATLLLAAMLASVVTGAMSVPMVDALLFIGQRLTGLGSSALAPHEQAVVWELRLPRTLLAMLVGALLAQCGAVMQGMFRNPLADPGIIGVSAGAAVGAVLAIFFSTSAMTVWSVPLGAFGGGLICSLLVYQLARSPLGTSVLVLLLAGIAISALAGSLIGLLSYLADDARLRDVTLWQMGSLAAADTWRLSLLAAAAVLLTIRFNQRAAALNALLLGEAEARHLGIDVEVMKRELILLVALGVGLAVAAAGVIGFIGLVVPHLVRTLTGPDHRSLLPLSALGGALLLLLADLISRVLVAPAELPVGIVTGLLGAPFFILLLRQLKGRF
ncbi:FecCD family ABC transporter permease [Pseudohongiella spirulinae]|uniref:ABC-type Fe3+-siderophore transport system, permease component n=1 Tax=Pseudohongiella spirulinae TaxID=1249552 RepID=A0A0S2KG45_9GAMM|nr:iron ABC transporter permease [Pseudohongiella spirulinae]ALO47157.1 ABC-type Fe3+-siderophore transport system, permease component [Pseudohongiella spirulinae]